MPFPIAAALAAGASITGGVLQNRANRKAQDRAFQQNREFFNERFDKEASYNHPVQQMARMKEAGLNPSLMYKTGSGASGSTSAPSSQGKIAERYEMGQLAAQSAQVANIIAQTAKTKKETTLLGENIQGKQISNEIANLDRAMKQIDQGQYSEEAKARLNSALSRAKSAETESQSRQEQLDAYVNVYKQAAANGMDLKSTPLQIITQGLMNGFFKTQQEVKDFLQSVGATPEQMGIKNHSLLGGQY
tara:strand:+ start:2225 stop:2965 length:741 start_codon:yes stop_codon:yes gene_type:complete